MIKADRDRFMHLYESYPRISVDEFKELKQLVNKFRLEVETL